MLPGIPRIYALSGRVLFVRCGPEVSDAELLEALGLEARPPEDDDNPMHIGRNAQWAHILDNSSYTLDNAGRVDAGSARLSRSHEVLSFWLGDGVNGYGLWWYRDGRLVRHRLSDPMTGEEADEGEPAAFEAGFSWPDGGQPDAAMWSYVLMAGVDAVPTRVQPYSPYGDR